MRGKKALGLAAASGAFVCVAGVIKVHADIYAGGENSALFGNVDQNTAGINNGSNACGPTSIFNSFTYLVNEFPSAGIGGLTSSGATNSINTLTGDMPNGIPVQGGNDMITGKQAYINALGYSNKISTEQLGNNTILSPTAAASFIAQQLNKGQDVEMGIIWSDANGNPLTGTNAGGHVVTVTGIDFDSSGSNGTMAIIDPWDGVDIPNGNLTVGTNGALILGYTGGGAGTGGGDGQDPDNPGDAGHGDIAFVTAESVTPEPSLVGIGFMVVAAMGLARRRSSRVEWAE
jgi:hypothetical protein